MKRPPDLDHLLRDLLAETESGRTREVLLAQTLRHARRRRTVRQLNRAALAVAAVLSLATILWQPTPPARLTTTRAGSPTASELIVRTQALPAEFFVATTSGSMITVASTVPITIIETSTISRGFHDLDDQQLLALLAGRPVALVRHAGPEAELVFVNREDQEGFRLE